MSARDRFPRLVPAEPEPVKRPYLAALCLVLMATGLGVYIGLFLSLL